MAFIVEQFAGDASLQLGCEELIRPMSFGTNWQRLRIAVRYAVYGSTTLSTNYFIRLGVCTGNNASLSNSTTDALWCVPIATGYTYTPTGSPLYYLAGTAQAFYTYQRIGSVDNNTLTLSSATPAYSASPTNLRSFAAVDITKGVVGSVNLPSVAIYYMTAAQVVTDMAQSAFYTALANDSTPTGTTGMSSTGGSLLRTAKDWNSVFVTWPRSTPACVVYDFAVVRYL